MLVDLKAKPFYLKDEDVKWVHDTIRDMSIEEKIGQLFFNMGASRDEAYLKNVVDRYHIGGIRYNPATAEEIYEQNRILQENSKIPLIIACNTENGGDGACTNGTRIGSPVKVGATGNVRYAYELGRISNREAAAIGCNLSFAPVVDINLNWRNPIISTRCFSNDAETVRDMSIAYLDGARQNEGFCCAAKHFPGDGIDERDQHLSNSVNTMSCEEWDETFGKVYAGLIDSGLEAIMSGHIMLPSYTRHFSPGIADQDIEPATLSRELLNGLLRKKLGFNGMILTDASHMVGLTCRKKRSDMLPAAIAAGCDMFLFFNEMEEDFASMLAGYHNGVISQDRLQEALERILGLKARMGLHKKQKTGIMPPRTVMGDSIGHPGHKAMTAEIADQAITLVKYLDKDVLPLTPERYKKILLVPVKGLATASLADLMHIKAAPAYDKFADMLRARGFEVEIFENPLVKHQKRIAAGEKSDINLYFAGKTPIADFVAGQDLVLTFSEVSSSFQVVERVAWSMTKGGGEIPWYVHEQPVVVVSVAHPFLLADVPQARTYINTYDSKPETLEALLDKLCGQSPFKGHDPVDAYCGLWDTRF